MIIKKSIKYIFFFVVILAFSIMIYSLLNLGQKNLVYAYGEECIVASDCSFLDEGMCTGFCGYERYGGPRACSLIECPNACGCGLDYPETNKVCQGNSCVTLGLDLSHGYPVLYGDRCTYATLREDGQAMSCYNECATDADCCSCTDWDYSYPLCGASPCGLNEKIRVRSCTPDQCYAELECYYDASCENNPDIDINLSPLLRTINQGDSTFYSVDISSVDNFVGTVNLTDNCNNIETLGASCLITNPVVDLSAGETEFRNLSVTNTSSITPTTYTLSISGSSGSLSDSDSAQLTVNSLITPPSIFITSPTEGTNYPDSDIALIVNASDVDGDLASCGLKIDSGNEISYPVAGGVCPNTYLSYTNLSSSVPISSGRVLALDFAENAGTKTYDRSGSGNTGTLTNGPTWVAGKYGKGLNFDGTDDYVELGNPANLNFTGQITMAAWVKMDRMSGSSDFLNIISHGFTLSPDAEVVLRALDGQYQVGSWNSGGDHLAKYNTPAEDIGSWVFIVGTYDGNAWRLYRNGVEVAVTVDPVGTISINSSWRIGATSYDQARFFDGTIDEVAIWNRALTLTEIQDMFNNTAFDGEHTMVATAYDTGGRSAQDEVNFKINLSEPAITLSPTSMSFTADQDGPASPSFRTLNIKNTGDTDSQLNWTAMTNKSWCKVDGLAQITGGPLSKDASSNVSVTLLPTSSPGVLICQISVSDNTASNSPQPTNVTYNVTPAPSTQSLTIVCVGKGTVTADPIGAKCNISVDYEEGTGVTLTATPIGGRIFAGWGGACSGRGECTLIINFPKTVYANFIIDPTYSEF